MARSEDFLFQVAVTGDCQFAIDDPDPSDSVSPGYSGECRDGRLHGQVTLTSYVQGTGVLLSTIYVGEWRDGQRHEGIETQYNPNGSRNNVQTGEWRYGHVWNGTFYWI